MAGACLLVCLFVQGRAACYCKDKVREIFKDSVFFLSPTLWSLEVAWWQVLLPTEQSPGKGWLPHAQQQRNLSCCVGTAVEVFAESNNCLRKLRGLLGWASAGAAVVFFSVQRSSRSLPSWAPPGLLWACPHGKFYLA